MEFQKSKKKRNFYPRISISGHAPPELKMVDTAFQILHSTAQIWQICVLILQGFSTEWRNIFNPFQWHHEFFEQIISVNCKFYFALLDSCFFSFFFFCSFQTFSCHSNSYSSLIMKYDARLAHNCNWEGAMVQKLNLFSMLLSQAK